MNSFETWIAAGSSTGGHPAQTSGQGGSGGSRAVVIVRALVSERDSPTSPTPIEPPAAVNATSALSSFGVQFTNCSGGGAPLATSRRRRRVGGGWAAADCVRWRIFVQVGGLQRQQSGDSRPGPSRSTASSPASTQDHSFPGQQIGRCDGGERVRSRLDGSGGASRRKACVAGCGDGGSAVGDAEFHEDV